MRVGIIQSNYIPWRGYFDFISSVDLFIFHDDLQYTKGDWRNRNKIKTRHGLNWLTVPVHYSHTAQLICETMVSDSSDWRSKHLSQIKENYGRAPFCKDVLEIFSQCLIPAKTETISNLNISLIKHICQYMEITTPFAMSEDFSPIGSKSARLITILKQVGATTYLSGPSADAYLDKSLFEIAGIHIEYKSYDYPDYRQLHGNFEPYVSVIDLLANCGKQSREFIRSRKSDIFII